MVTGHGAVGMIQDGPGSLTERVPDRVTPAVGVYGAFDLIRRRGDAPGEIGRERVMGRLSMGEEPVIQGRVGRRIIACQVHAGEDE